MPPKKGKRALKKATRTIKPKNQEPKDNKPEKVEPGDKPEDDKPKDDTLGGDQPKDGAPKNDKSQEKTATDSPLVPRPSTVEDDLTDVYYFDSDNRRTAIPEHEAALDTGAAKYAKLHNFEDQAGVVRGKAERRPKESIKRVRIVVDDQDLWTLYAKDYPPDFLATTPVRTDTDICPVRAFPGPVVLPPETEDGIDKITLRRCSSLADEYFAFEPDKTELHLPVEYPNVLVTYTQRWDYQRAYIHPDPIRNSIIPWINEVEAWYPTNNTIPTKDGMPTPVIPHSLADRIHLYNVMLQLGVPRFIQKELVGLICKDMYQRRLDECELDLLEVTIGRFHSVGMPILDPVINHLVGTYGFRDKSDRELVNRVGPQADRRHLEYGVRNAGRADFPHDTVILPPKLPVLGHSIKNWSGVRYRDGDVRAAHIGYPLNVGYELKLWRREPTDVVLGKRQKPPYPRQKKAEDGNVTEGGPPKKPKQAKPVQVEGTDYGTEDDYYTETSTCLLKDFREYYENIPGEAWAAMEGTKIDIHTLLNLDKGRHQQHSEDVQ